MSETRPEARYSSDVNDLISRAYIIEARRPIVIARHRNLLVEMDNGISNQFIDGSATNPRLLTMLAELDTPAMQIQIKDATGILTHGEFFRQQSLGQALIDHLCLIREQPIEVAALQTIAIGVYRLVRQAVERHQGVAPTLAEIRQIPMDRLASLISVRPTAFGHHDFPRWYTEEFRQNTLNEIRWLRQAPDVHMDTLWTDTTTGLALTRNDEAKVAHLPEEERQATLATLTQSRIRNKFYRQVFLDYLGPDEITLLDAAHYRHILAWLQDLARTPHLYPFLQGQTDAQKAFRISQLTTKIIQLFTIYAWVSHARANLALGPQLKDLDTRGCLIAIKRIGYPPLPADADTAFAALLCPFATFVQFLQERTAAQDFILPPDTRGR